MHDIKLFIVLIGLMILFVFIIENNYRICKLSTIKNGVGLLLTDKNRLSLLIFLPVVCIVIERYFEFYYKNGGSESNSFAPLFLMVECMVLIFISIIVLKIVNYLYIKWKIRILFYYGYYSIIALIIYLIMFSYLNNMITHDAADLFDTLVVIEIIVGTLIAFIKRFYFRCKKKCIDLHCGLILLLICNFLIVIIVYTQLNGLKTNDNDYFLNILAYALLLSPNILTCIFLPVSYEENKKINVSFLNLDMIDIIKNNFYVQDYTIKQPNSGRFFKVDISGFIDKEANSCNVIILNQINKTFRDKEVLSKEDSENRYIYFYVEDVKTRKSIFLKLQITYMLKGKRHCEIIDICLMFQRHEDEIIYVKNKILNHYKVRMEREIIYEGQMGRNVDLSSLMNKLYQYDYLPDFNGISSNGTSFDKRKWLVHRGGFGSGKSALDILSLSNNNKLPVVVSPWEENTNDDFLYLVFDHLSNSTGIRMFYPTQSVLFFFLATLIAVTVLLSKVIGYFIDIFNNLNVIDNLRLLALLFVSIANRIVLFISIYGEHHDDLISVLLIWGVPLLLSFFFTCILLPTIVIHAKNSTIVHQSYYLKGIRKMLKKSNAVLVIEDIDRFNDEKIELIFRLASSINRICYDHNQLVGLISYQTDKVQKTDSDHLNDLENKVIYDDYLKGYSWDESKTLYFHSCLRALLYYKCLIDGRISSTEKDENIDKYLKQSFESTVDKLNYNVITDNFRTIRKHLKEIQKIMIEQEDKLDNKIAKYITEHVF